MLYLHHTSFFMLIFLHTYTTYFLTHKHTHSKRERKALLAAIVSNLTDKIVIVNYKR